MKYFLTLILCFFLCYSPSKGFCQNIEEENEQLITQMIYLTHGIISQAPELIAWREGEKIYLNKARIEKHNHGGYVYLHDAAKVFLPIIFSDSFGNFVSTSREYLLAWSKAFHQICNDCDHEWEGSIFTFRCPRCKSTNISNISS